MAGIEKFCVYSEKWVGRDMYKYARNRLQILPWYRKEFRLNSFTNKKFSLEVRTTVLQKDWKYWKDGCIRRKKKLWHDYTLVVEGMSEKGKPTNYHYWSDDKRAFLNNIAKMLGISKKKLLEYTKFMYVTGR